MKNLLKLNPQSIKVVGLRATFLAAIFLAAFLICPKHAKAETEVYGPYYGQNVWTKAGSPYIIPNGLALATDSQLIIEPGVIVKFKPGGLLISGAGSLQAVGTAEEPIIITSYKDDVGGDSNGDGSASSPKSLDWNGIQLNNANDQMSFAEIRYGSRCLSLNANITVSNSYIHNCDVGIEGSWQSVENNRIVDNYMGFYLLYGGNGEIKHNLIDNNSYAGIYLGYAGAYLLKVDHNEISHNGYGIDTAYDSPLVLEDNNIENNKELGFRNEGAVNQEAINNWWGDVTGPYNLNANPGGKGNPVTDYVNFRPMLGASTDTYVDPTPPPVPIGKTPVLIVPGIMGTEMFKGTEKLWPDISRMLNMAGDRFMDPLAYDSSGNPVDNSLITGEVLGKPSLKFDYTDALINNLIAQGYQEGQNLFTFPYDWRKDLDSIAQNELKQFIDNTLSKTGSNKIDIIAHSQGGLVVKRLLYDNPDYAGKINKLVFVGTPNLGSPKAAKALLYGDSMGVDFLGLGLDPSEIQRIAHNIPAIYDLLPSEQYFIHDQGYLGIAKTFLNFITGYSIIDNYSDSEQYLKDQGLNSTLLDSAGNFHNRYYDDYDFSSSGIQVSNIVGCQEPTISQILAGKNGGFWLTYGPGDGTVPVFSANNIFGVNTYFAKKTKHGTMMTDDGNRQLIVNLISGSNLDIGQKITQDATLCRMDGRQVSVHSPVDLNIYDELGNHIGPNASGKTDMDIPNVQYDVLGTDKFAFLPNGHTYTIKLNATDNGSFDFYSEIIQNSETVDTAFYNDVPIMSSSQAVINLSDSNNSQIQLDVDGNGTIDKLIGPSSDLNVDQSKDLINPVTTAKVAGTAGQPGNYRSDVSVTLTAQDPIIAGKENETSGVLETKYNLDNAGYLQYNLANPLTITNEGVHTIKFYSTDKAGNNEDEKTLSFTIDKTPPEIAINYDPVSNAYVFQATDNLDPAPSLSCSDSSCTTQDQAGNKTVLMFSKIDKKTSNKLVLTSIAYNQNPPVVFPSNSFTVALKDIDQSFTLHGIEIEKMRINYDSRKNQSTVLTNINSISSKSTLSGLKLLQLSTKQGNINIGIK